MRRCRYSSAAALICGQRSRAGGFSGRGVHALFDAGDEIELPGPALDLPVAERHEAGKGKRRADHEDHPCGRGALAAGHCVAGVAVWRRGRRQGMFFMSCTDIGIMLAFMWYMTQSEPASVMTTSTMVKISASMFHPLSDLASMCRK